jgi:hypothetical protein
MMPEISGWLFQEIWKLDTPACSFSMDRYY